MTTNSSPVEGKPMPVMRTYQKDGAAWLAEAGKAILADPVGSGKSCTALHAVGIRGSWPLLVVCPSTVKYQWRDEVLKWYPDWGDAIDIVKDGKHAIPLGKRVVIINYDLLSRKWDQLRGYGFKAILGDEAAKLKEDSSKRSTAFRAIAETCPTVYLLTATPMMNRPRELAHLLHLIGRLWQFGGKRKFEEHFCEGKLETVGGRWISTPEGKQRVGGRKFWYNSGAANLAELKMKLYDEIVLGWEKPCMLRRKKADILPELPANQEVVIPVKIHNMAEYRQARDDFAAWTAGKGMKAIAEGDDVGAAEALASMDESEILKSTKALRLRQIVGESKVATAIQWVDDFLEETGGEKLVIFAHHIPVQHALLGGLLSKGLRVAAIQAEMVSEERARNINRFQSDPETRVIVCSLLAAGEGVTLTAASTCLFVESRYGPAELEQAQGRINRIGQTADKTVSYLMRAMGTIDEHMAGVIAAKRMVIDSVVGAA